MDNEYIILDEIFKNEKITQRQLSHIMKLSLGSVNLLLNKMIKDGLVKLRHIPMNRVIYMLTPKGMSEKARKTYDYINFHYHCINQTRDKIKTTLNNIINEKGCLSLIVVENDLGNLVKSASQDLHGIKLIKKPEDSDTELIIVADENRYKELYSQGYYVINLLQLL